MLKIRDLREAKDLTQKQLSKLLDCTQQTYSRYETGEITIDIYNLIKLANFYHTSVDYLLGLTNDANPYTRLKNAYQIFSHLYLINLIYAFLLILSF